MAKVSSLRNGLHTDLSAAEAPVGSWRELTNGVPRTEGITPLLSFLAATEIKRQFSWSTQGLLTSAACFALVRDDWLYMSANTPSISGNLGDRWYLYIHEKGVVVNSTVLSGTVGVTQALSFSEQLSSAVNNFDTADLSRCIQEISSTKVILFRDRVIASTVLVVTPNINRPVNAALDYPITRLIKSLPGLLLTDPDLLAPLDDIHNNTSATVSNGGLTQHAPGSLFFDALDEYLCVAGGMDNSEGIPVPSAAALQRQRQLFRWAAPDTIDEWSPDLTNIPPQWFSGNLLLPAAGDILDMFVANGQIYVVQELGVTTMTKVGGSLGFSQSFNPLRFALEFPAYHTCVPTSHGTFFLNASGLQMFDGYSIMPQATQASSLFTLEYLTQRWGVGFSVVKPHWGVHKKGLHIPAMSTVVWFVTLIVNTTGKEVIQAVNGNNLASGATPQLATALLMYNYDLGQASVARSPTGVMWFPFTGVRPGLSEFTVATGVSKLFSLTPVPGVPRVDPVGPVADVVWTTGFFSVAEASAEFIVNRLFLQYHGTGFEALLVVANLYSSESSIADSVVQLGTMAEFSSRLWKDVRFTARFVTFTFSGTPSGSSDAELQGIGIDAVMTGTRW